MKTKDMLKKITKTASFLYLLGFLMLIIHVQGCKETSSALSQELPSESFSEETIALEPLTIKWYNDSFVKIPIWKD